MAGPRAGREVSSGQGTRQASYQPYGQPQETGLEPHTSLLTLVRNDLGAHSGKARKKEGYAGRDWQLPNQEGVPWLWGPISLFGI